MGNTDEFKPIVPEVVWPITRVVNRHTCTPLEHRTGEYIGRGTIYGNPWVVGVDGDRAECLRRYRAYFYDRLARDAEFKQAVLALRGRILVCSCAPLGCHGNIIAEYLNLLLKKHKFFSRPYKLRRN